MKRYPSFQDEYITIWVKIGLITAALGVLSTFILLLLGFAPATQSYGVIPVYLSTGICFIGTAIIFLTTGDIFRKTAIIMYVFVLIVVIFFLACGIGMIWVGL